jgi:hypothetical protein
MRHVRLGIIVVLLALLLGVATPAQAEDEKNRGLFVTPLRQYVTVANITERATTITMSVEQFSVDDYTYSHRFGTLRESWVKLSATQFTLQPGKSQVVTYSITPSADASPGGHYFTIFASSVFHTNGIPSQVRAATTLYVTINGDLKHTAIIKKETIPFVAFGGDISFKLDVQGTGNAHFFTYSSGELLGFSAQGKGAESTHLLLPGTSRILGSTIPAPILPGVYKAVYGYRTDKGQTVQRERYLVYLPPWSLLIPIGITWLVLTIRKKRRGY